MTELKTIQDWLKEETQGLNKDFDKNALIFSYNDILEIKQLPTNWIKELRVRPAITLAEMNIGASDYENPKLETELIRMIAHLAEQIFCHFFNIKEGDLK